jgi:hypothetical protein
MVSCCILGKYHARLPHRHGNPPQTDTEAEPGRDDASVVFAAE